MLRDFVAAIAMALAVLSATSQASAQRVCGEHAVIEARLAELYGERPFALGIASSGNLVEVLYQRTLAVTRQGIPISGVL